MPDRATAMCVATLTLAAGALRAGSNETVLYTFQGGDDGASPDGALIADASGNLYGTTQYGGGGICTFGGFSGCGTVFQLIPPSTRGGAWTENVLYRFQGGADGAFPSGGLLLDRAGNLYGTTAAGGNTATCYVGETGCGTVFRLRRPASAGGTWTETVLYTFQGGADGFAPGNLTADGAGDLYSVTTWGGSASCQCGAVFKLSRGAGGGWTKSVLHTFQGVPAGQTFGDGSGPIIGVTFDGKGNLYGVTAWGGTYIGGDEGGSTYGTVFWMSPPAEASGSWNYAVLHRFGNYLQNPVSGVVIDRAGGIYGTTYQSVFALVPGTALPIYLFNGSSRNGGYLPYGGVIPDTAGNLYGTTIGGGNQSGQGVVFKLKRPAQAGSPWTETVLHEFTGSPDGDGPDAPLLLRNGVLYGTTLRGGNQGCQVEGSVGCGTVFAVVP